MRFDGRNPEELRHVRITTNYLNKVSSSVLVEFGDTKVLCAASFETKQPPFLLNTEEGWVTSEYSMLPCSSDKRISRERSKVSGRTQEIQRLIGRSLRAIVDRKKLNKTTITIDCDVLQADGGTRTASITGAYVSISLLFREMLQKGLLFENPLIDSVSAISAGIINGEVLVDLNYPEDSSAEVDMNFVMTGSGKIIEVQGTAEEKPFTKKELDLLYDVAEKSCKSLKELQDIALNFEVK